MNKEKIVKVRLTVPEKRRLEYKAKQAGLSMSEFMRRSLDNRMIKSRLNKDEQELFRELIQEANRWQSVANMFRKKDPQLSQSVKELKNEFRNLIVKNFS